MYPELFLPATTELTASELFSEYLTFPTLDDHFYGPDKANYWEDNLDVIEPLPHCDYTISPAPTPPYSPDFSSSLESDDESNGSPCIAPAALTAPLRDMTPISDDESDDESADEYIPPPPSPRRRPKSRRAVKTRKTRRSVKKEPSASPPPPTRRRRSGRAPALRNKLSANPEKLSAIISRNEAVKHNFTCPECGWKQDKQRAADFYRHINTHVPREPLWCSGIPLPLGEECGPDGQEPYEFEPEGIRKVGGCLTKFSRMDALRRHLNNSPNCLAEERLR